MFTKTQVKGETVAEAICLAHAIRDPEAIKLLNNLHSFLRSAIASDDYDMRLFYIAWVLDRRLEKLSVVCGRAIAIILLDDLVGKLAESLSDVAPYRTRAVLRSLGTTN